MLSRRFCLGVILGCLLIPPHAALSATVATTGIISGETTWSRDDTVLVSGILIVAVTGRLTVEAGTRVFCDPGARLIVSGELRADGGSTQRILFTSRADTVGGQPTAGAWGGIIFQSNGQGLLRHCDIRYATECVSALGSSPTVENSVIENFSIAGCNIDGYDAFPRTTPRIEDCIIMQTDPELVGVGSGIAVYHQADVTITGCRVRRCRDGIGLYGYSVMAPYFTITNSEIGDNARYGIYTYAEG